MFRQPGTREASPTRVPSTKQTKLTHITCRSGTLTYVHKIRDTQYFSRSDIHSSSAERDVDSRQSRDGIVFELFGGMNALKLIRAKCSEEMTVQ
jgi:hypothetical protein